MYIIKTKISYFKKTNRLLCGMKIGEIPQNFYNSYIHYVLLNKEMPLKKTKNSALILEFNFPRNCQIS